MKKYIILFYLAIYLFPSIAYALPLPEFASAAFGIGELIAISLTLITLIFPFLNKSKLKNHISIYLVLILSLFFNIHYLQKEEWFPHYNDDTDDHTGMIWNEVDRNKDIHAINELDAYQILKQQQNDPGIHKYVFLDTRTRSETELGTAQGFTKYNWADLAPNYKNDLKDKIVIVTCWTGMRGSEICSKLRALGINCKYLKGGLQAWNKLNLPLNLNPNVSREQFGTMEAFPNYSTFLSTKETVHLSKSGAHIIDIRSIKQFQQQSIKNSINIDFNNIGNNSLEYQIHNLPASKKGFIITCFGTVSCSEAPSLGWELNRLGLKYLGAYSGGIESFNKNYSPSNSLLQNIGLLYQNINTSIINHIKSLSHIISPILLFSFLIILLSVILWTTKKLSYIYFHNRTLRQQEKQVLHQTYQDTILIDRENNFFIKQDLKYSLYSFLPLLLILGYSYFFNIVSTVFSYGELFHFSNWNDIVGISLVSILPSIIFTIGLQFVLFKNKLHSKNYVLQLIIFYLISFFLFLFILKDFSYIHLLIFTATFLLMSSIDFFIVTYYFIKKIYHKWVLKHGYISISQAYDYIPKNTKASTLSFLKQKGFNIPLGFVITQNYKNNLSIQSQQYIIKQLGDTFTVRSSALNEDQVDSSHAGLNLSIVPAKAEHLIQHIKQVFSSYNNSKSNLQEVVLLQKLINPTISGVAFSQHPQWGGVILIEWGIGLSGNRLEGSENSEQTVIERSTGKIIYSTKHNSHLLNHVIHIFNTIIALEKIYQYSVDIEWAIDEENFWLLQVRPQTSLEHLNYSTIDQDKQRLLQSNFVPLKSCELSYSMLHCNRFSASLICHLWEPGSSADIASRLALWKWNQSILKQNPYVYTLGKIWQSDYKLLNKPTIINWYMAQKNFNVNYQNIKKQSHILLEQNRINLSINWNTLSSTSYLSLWNNTLTNFKQLQSFTFYFELMAQQALEEVLKKSKKLNIDGKKLLKSNMQHLYGEHIPYRSNNDYDISSPRNIEINPSLTDIKDLESFKFNHFNYKNIPNNLLNKIKFAQQLLELREIYKYYSLQVFYLLRLAILDLQTRFNIQENVFELDIKEIPELFTMSDHQRKEFISLLEQRVIDNKILHNIEQVDYLDSKQLALFNREENNHIKNKTINNKKPIFVSNPSDIKGKLIYLEGNLSIEDIEKLLIIEEPFIIYSHFISPQIVQLAQKYNIIGLCSLYGSLLSHNSILAREANLPFLIYVQLNEETNGKLIIIKKEGMITIQ